MIRLGFEATSISSESIFYGAKYFRQLLSNVKYSIQQSAINIKSASQRAEMTLISYQLTQRMA